MSRISPARSIQPKRNYNALQFEYEWTYGLCDCCTDCKLCCQGFWCLPCLQCILFTDAREYIFTCCGTKSLGNLRSKIRASYRIKGKLDSDAAAACCCPCCATIQMKRELITQGEA
ncbi:unnamed protein product [Brachionus calyciflorus]|uniref:Cornifelin n=1 Tax=Brachionus calyciflorus TaxID=104777 RepID=A0A813P9C8_9BILA|nr:unnamed protein product [Brachionus calyciflorus]